MLVSAPSLIHARMRAGLAHFDECLLKGHELEPAMEKRIGK